MNTKHICPECNKDSLVVREVTSYYLNTGGYYCNSVKQYDDNAVVSCLNCGWIGVRAEFKDNE